MEGDLADPDVLVRLIILIHVLVAISRLVHDRIVLFSLISRHNGVLVNGAGVVMDILVAKE